MESLTSGVMAALLIGLACTLFLRSAPFQYMMAGLRSAFAGGAAGVAPAARVTSTLRIRRVCGQLVSPMALQHTS